MAFKHVATCAIALLFLAPGIAAAQPLTGHASSDAILDPVFVGSLGEGR